MARYLDPKNDVPFLRIFGRNPDLLISFLNALIPFEEGRVIKTVEYFPIESIKSFPLDRYSTITVRCKDNFDRQFIVAIQIFFHNMFTGQIRFNSSGVSIVQLDNRDYTPPYPLYLLMILNDILPQIEDANFYHHYLTVNMKNSNDAVKGIELVLIELPKFKPETFSNRKMATLWLRFLREVHEGVIDVDAELLENENICKAIDLCVEYTFSHAEMYAYENCWDNVRTQVANAIEFSEKGKMEEKMEGEMKERIEVIINSQKAGLPIDLIATITKLTPEEVIEILTKKNQNL
ncbi:MAG: Rpn family recombination-promoting nuclease/putative transposase [Prevotellaceae bacterium]|nr:Rpn family recombination-promoting nuclease/putative transposase [Prevotellaceae bacterium]